MGFVFYETSAKLGANVKALFNDLAKTLTGIEFEPKIKSEVKHRGFVLG